MDGVNMSEPVVSLISPSDIGRVGGFLGRRFRANRVARLKNWALSEQFIQLHERKDHTDRFWIGEHVGKWLDAAVYAGLIGADEELLARVNEILQRLAKTQDRDGYLGVTARRLRNPVRAMELYEMVYVLHGLLVCGDLLDNDLALEMARKLGTTSQLRGGRTQGSTRWPDVSPVLVTVAERGPLFWNPLF